jgi:translocation and assembly module TamA
LRSLGYYDGVVETDLVPPAPAAGGGKPGPYLVRFLVTPGPLYSLAELRLELSDNPNGFVAPTLERLGLKAGEPARAQAVLDAEQKLQARARKESYALAALGRRSTVIDGERHTMDVVLRLATGPKATFAEPTFTGSDGVRTRFLRNRLGFRADDPFNPDRLEEGRRALYDSGLFSTVTVEEGKELTADGQLPISVAVTPRAPRSVGASLGYQTDTGPSGNLFWEHRNLLGAGERLRVETELGLKLQRLQTTFRKPDFFSRKQSLLGDVEAKKENTDSYDSQSASTGLGVERQLAPGLTGSLGLAYRYARIQEEDEPEQNYGLVSIPAKLDWDFSNDLLNPSRGGRLALSAAPYQDTLGAERRFLKSRITHSRYIRLLDRPRTVLALRGSLGSLVGTSREEVPADERFYAGGGGSVRGIPYQLAGPLDDDKPEGGRSLIELSTELRFRITESFGAVAFLDGGTVSSSSLPSLDEELHWGFGPGLRYFTPIGPLRLDVGFPLSRRDSVDDLFQLYLSIGQAF